VPVAGSESPAVSQCPGQCERLPRVTQIPFKTRTSISTCQLQWNCHVRVQRMQVCSSLDYTSPAVGDSLSCIAAQHSDEGLLLHCRCSRPTTVTPCRSSTLTPKLAKSPPHTTKRFSVAMSAPMGIALIHREPLRPKPRCVELGECRLQASIGSIGALCSRECENFEACVCIEARPIFIVAICVLAVKGTRKIRVVQRTKVARYTPQGCRNVVRA